jgi:hypothetical protein
MVWARCWATFSPTHPVTLLESEMRGAAAAAVFAFQTKAPKNLFFFRQVDVGGKDEKEKWISGFVGPMSTALLTPFLMPSCVPASTCAIVISAGVGAKQRRGDNNVYRSGNLGVFGKRAVNFLYLHFGRNLWTIADYG